MGTSQVRTRPYHVEIQARPPSQTVSEKLMSATGGSEHQTFVIRLPLNIRAYDQDDRTFRGEINFDGRRTRRVGEAEHRKDLTGIRWWNSPSGHGGSAFAIAAADSGDREANCCGVRSIARLRAGHVLRDRHPCRAYPQRASRLGHSRKR